MPPYEWGMMNTPYSPRPDISTAGKPANWDRILHTPRTLATMVDLGRQQEVDDFYKVLKLYL